MVDIRAGNGARSDVRRTKPGIRGESTSGAGVALGLVDKEVKIPTSKELELLKYADLLESSLVCLRTIF